jgi:hypothetical protein
LRRITHRYAGVVAVVLAALALAGCSGVDREQGIETGGRPVVGDKPDLKVVDTLWKGEAYGWVRLVEAEPQAGTLEHPAKVDAEWLRKVLAEVKVQDDRDRRRTAFTAEQLDKLVPPLVRGLARATPDQEVVFAITGKRGGAAFFNPNLVTTGRLFVSGGKLNVIFGMVQESFEDQLRATGYLKTFKPGTRQARIEDDWVVRSTTWGAEPKRDDWFAIAYKEGSGAMPKSGTSASTAKEAPADSGTSEEGGAEAANAADGQSSTAAQSGQTEKDYGDVRERLQVLKRLHDDGLISDEEYDRKRGEILDDL